MSDTSRVFITGVGALTACGLTAEETWNSILAGKHGIDEIRQWDISSWKCRLGGELKNFQPSKMLPDRKLIKVISRQDVIGISAAVQAVEHSQMLKFRESLNHLDLYNEQTGVYVGSPGNKYFQQYDFLPLLAKTNGDMKMFAEQLFSDVHPMWLLRILPNNVLAYTGITYGFKGPNHNVTNHAVGGIQALIEAYHAIKSGQAERAVVVGYDLGTEPQALYYYDKLGVLSHRHLKPFNHDHDGTILAEGGAAVVIESETSVKARDAKCYGEITGGCAKSESAGLFSLQSSGEHLSDLLSATLAAQNLSPREIGLLVAHGNGNPPSDLSEARAIDRVFGNESVPVTAFKWATGHTICASGLVDVILATFALNTKCIPGIPGFTKAAATCERLQLSAEHRNIDERKAAVVINRGYASMNACLVIKPCE